jgi:hypothetical protein
MICSSLNRLAFMRPSPSRDGLYLKSAGREGGRPALAAENSAKSGDGEAADTAYPKLLERIRQKEQEREDLVFKRFLERLFGQIASANSVGISRPRALYLPGPPPLYRVRFDRSGAGRIEPSPLRARVDEVYELLSGLDLSRFRRCSGCEERKLFWATRVDQVGCGKVCINRIRVLNFNVREKQAAGDPVPPSEQTVLCSLDHQQLMNLEANLTIALPDYSVTPKTFLSALMSIRGLRISPIRVGFHYRRKPVTNPS